MQMILHVHNNNFGFGRISIKLLDKFSQKEAELLLVHHVVFDFIFHDALDRGQNCEVYISIEILLLSFLGREHELIDVEYRTLLHFSEVGDGSDQFLPHLLQLGTVFAGFPLGVLVGVAHFPEVPGYDGAGEGAAEFLLDIPRKVNCGVEFALGKRSLDQLLYLSRLLVFPLLVEGSQQCPSLHLLGRTVLPVFVEDGGVA